MTRALPLLLLGAAAVVVPLLLWHQNKGLRAENAALRAAIETTGRIQDADPGDLSDVPNGAVDDGLRALGR